MTKLLRKIFIKNYQKTDDPKIRQKHGFLAGFVGIFTNLLLFVFKLLIGIFIFSMSIISDAINNLTDMASCIVNLIGFKLAGKPADKEHPFGHERIEYITGLIISFVIIAIAIVLGYTSIIKIINKEVTRYDDMTSTIATFVILAVAIIVKLWQGIFYRKIAKAIDSISLKANAQDSINDVISTSAVLLATIVEFILYKNGLTVQIDGFMGIAVSLFIVIMGIKMIVESSNPLIGEMPNNDLVKNVIKDITSMDGVLGIHDLMCHSYGPTKIFMTIHVEVDYKNDIMTSHDLMDNIETLINQKYNVILTCHMDPIVTDSKQVNDLHKIIKEVLNGIDRSLSFHDLRTVEGPTHTNVLFDVVIPYGIKAKQDDIILSLQNAVKKDNTNYNLVVHFDHEYIENN